MSDDWSQFPTTPPAEHDWSAFPTEAPAANDPVQSEELFQPDTSGSRRLNARFNNPGALGLSPLGRSFGATASGVYDTGHPFAAFPTKEAGAAAQFSLWQNREHYLGHTLRDAITNWIGPGEHGEAEYISQKTGIPLHQPITAELLRSPQGIRLMQAQAQYEGQNVLSPEEWQRAQDRAYNHPHGRQDAVRNNLADMARQISSGQTPAIPDAGSDDWSAFPTTSPQPPQKQAQPPDRNLVDDGTETGRNARAIAGAPAQPQDWSAFPTTPPAPQDVPRGTQEAITGTGTKQQSTQTEQSSQPQEFQPQKSYSQATQFEPETQPPQDTAFDTVHKTVQNFWENAKQSAAQLNLGAQEGSAYNPTLPTDPIEQEIRATQASTILSDEQKAQTIAALRKGQTTVQANRMGSIATEKANIAQAEAAKPDKAFQQGVLGQVSSFAGQATPYLASGAAGPIAPILMATQMTAGAYASAIDRSTADIKRLHPDWDDARVLTEANAVANESGKAAGLSGLALSLIPIPVAGPLIARIVERMGISGATIAIAQVYAGAQENIALKKSINPSQDVYEGLDQLAKTGFVQGLAFGGAHALGEIGIGGAVPQRPAAEVPRPEKTQVTPPPPEPRPEAQTQTQPQPQGQAAAVIEDNGESVEERTPAPTPPTPERIARAYVKIGGKVYEGPSHPMALQQYLEATGLDQNPYSLGADYIDRQGGTEGFVTNTGRLVNADEAHRIATASNQITPGYTREPGMPALVSEQVSDTYPRGANEPAEFYSGIPLPKIGPMIESPIGRAIRETVLPNREVVAQYPHTDQLLTQLDQFRAEQGELQGRVAQLNHLYGQLEKKNPKLTDEINSIGKYVEENQALPSKMSPEAQRWLNEANNGLYRDIGDRMRAGGFKTVLPDGTTRPFIGAPPDVTPFPRIMRPDVADVLDNKELTDAQGRLTPEARAIYDEGVRTINKNTGNPFFSSEQDLLDLADQRRAANEMNAKNNPAMSGLEKARVVKYPSFFYTYSPQAMLDTMMRQSTEIARLNAFGQKIGRAPDLFDKTEEAINKDLSLSGNKIKSAVNSIGDLRSFVYGTNRRGAATRILRGISSAGLAGSPHTSTKIGLSMLFNVPAYRGLGRTLSGILNTSFRYSQNMTELRRLGLSNDVILNLHDDPTAVTTAEQKASNIFTGVLRVAGHALAQDIGKSVTAAASKSWLTKFAIPKLQSDPGMTRGITRMIAADIRRRGMDPAAFKAPNIDPKLVDRFIREDVNDIQTAYRPEDYPAWASKSELGSLAFQFGHWAYNGARTIIRDSVMPMARAAQNNDFSLVGHYMGRLAGIALASAGASEAWRQVDKLFGGSSNVATIAEITQAFIRGNPAAAHLLVNRLVQDIIGAPTIGMFGDIANWVKGIASGTADTTHFFNPSAPAGFGYLKIMLTATNQAMQQGGKLSDRQKANFASQLAGLVKGYYDLANTVQAPLPGHAEAMGRREDKFVKSRLDLFYQENPAWDKRMKGGTFAGNVHTPYLQNLNEALISGNATSARQIMRQMQKDLKLDSKQLETSVRESVRSHEPMPTGKAGQAFSLWARRTLTPDETQRMRAIQGVYSRTATRAGIALKE